MTGPWLEAAAQDMERLKWLVLRRFSVLPGSEAARHMGDADYVWCGLQMLLDKVRGEGSSPLHGEAGENGAFDPAEYERLGASR